MTFYHVELPDLDTLAKVATPVTRPDDIAKMDQAWNVGLVGSYFYTFTSEPSVSSSPDGAEDVQHFQVQSRMFLAGLEDPATGSAACGFSAMLALTKSQSRVVQVEIVQGFEMGRKSLIGVKIELNEKRDAVERMELSGSAVRVMQGTLEI
jgi:predicted PhzF superfamily epimerase YddE/YHI9